jgi:hypothetical protein
MSCVAKSAFWLGLVYSAMPFDSTAPIAHAPRTTAIPHAAGSVSALAGAVIQTSGQSSDDWKSAVAIAAALCASNCPGRTLTRLEPSKAPVQKERAELRRGPSPAKSD